LAWLQHPEDLGMRLRSTGSGGLAVLELLNGQKVRARALGAGQAVPNRRQPLRRPRLDQFGELGLATEAVERVEAVAAAFSGVASAVMRLSVSIVEIVIVVVLCAARGAVMTWITPPDCERTAILN
jgi:hypothetical protein